MRHKSDYPVRRGASVIGKFSYPEVNGIVTEFSTDLVYIKKQVSSLVVIRPKNVELAFFLSDI